MFTKMEYNFHTHTFRCGHAFGNEREYIEEAIAAGVREMGFSDHAPWIDPKLGTERNYVVPYAQIDDYFSTLRALRQEYRDKITLHIGFEAEYDPADPKELIALGAEYLILGQHFYKTPEGYIYAGFYDYEHYLHYYVDAVVAGICSGYYTYVAHPDVFNYRTGDSSVYQKEMMRICEASLECGVPLEINFLGIRQGRYYPTPLFWEMVGDVQAPVTFGMDAHSPDVAADFKSIETAATLVEKYHLNYIGKPKLVLLR